MRLNFKTSTALMGLTIALSTLIGVTAANSAKKDQKNKKEKEIIKVIGEPENCINPRNIISTNVIDKKTIEFRMVGRRFFRNIMKRNCPGLNKFDSIAYEIRGSQLCHVETFTVLKNTGGSLQGFAKCSFGKFQQIEKVKAKDKTKVTGKDIDDHLNN